MAATSLGALGVVYGDIGTSPLYALKECLSWPHSPHAVKPEPEAVLGVLSLVFWALMLVVVLKYLVFVLRADNKGEGGILALAALVEPNEHADHNRGRLAIAILLALFGAGLLFGDGLITPAISVLGAMEGLSEQNPSLTYLVAPITCAILVGLFFAQRFGTGRIGNVFGWVMLIWFIAIGVAGARWVATNPSVLQAVDPRHAITFLTGHGWHGFLLLGSVFLVVTGGEALYADMGHFGRVPIRIAWFTIALPGLLLNYFGQGALLLAREPGTVTNPFYALVEGPFLIPMLVLATMAAVIASQALISGVFSLTRQAMQLGFWPRLTVVHTSAQTEGQIYIPEMNYLMLVGCVVLVLQFRTSSALAAAYGIAVTATMAITSILFYMLCVRRWDWPRRRAIPLLVLFLVFDLAFLAACSVKILDGGWFPLSLGVAVFAIMTTWWRGRLELARIMESGAVPTDLFLADLEVNPLPRVEGTAIFMSSSHESVPNVVLHHVKHNRVMHQEVVLCSVSVESVPWVPVAKNVDVKPLGQGMFRMVARVGFMQSPNVPAMVARCAARGDFRAEPMTTTYYLGRQTLIVTGKAKMARWRKILFSFLARNSRPPTSFFDLPPNRVVELGLQIEI
ncbi:MAG TPA: KUP/HAK/KT family potassium transporter [Kofleriaceae bacterium]|nr:KUP/HAK/KT family potassium transporter [Kofleriaceae bacterium]